MKVDYNDGKTSFSLYAGTQLRLGVETVTLTSDVRVTADGFREYGAILEMIAATKQLHLYGKDMTRVKDGKIIEYDHTGGIRSETDVPTPEPKPKTKPNTKVKAKK